jgi:hypothetical protein
VVQFVLEPNEPLFISPKEIFNSANSQADASLWTAVDKIVEHRRRPEANPRFAPVPVEGLGNVWTLTLYDSESQTDFDYYLLPDREHSGLSPEEETIYVDWLVEQAVISREMKSALLQKTGVSKKNQASEICPAGKKDRKTNTALLRSAGQLIDRQILLFDDPEEAVSQLLWISDQMTTRGNTTETHFVRDQRTGDPFLYIDIRGANRVKLVNKRIARVWPTQWPEQLAGNSRDGLLRHQEDMLKLAKLLEASNFPEKRLTDQLRKIFADSASRLIAAYDLTSWSTRHPGWFPDTENVITSRKNQVTRYVSQLVAAAERRQTEVSPAEFIAGWVVEPKGATFRIGLKGGSGAVDRILMELSINETVPADETIEAFYQLTGILPATGLITRAELEAATGSLFNAQPMVLDSIRRIQKAPRFILPVPDLGTTGARKDHGKVIQTMRLPVTEKFGGAARYPHQVEVFPFVYEIRHSGNTRPAPVDYWYFVRIPEALQDTLDERLALVQAYDTGINPDLESRNPDITAALWEIRRILPDGIQTVPQLVMDRDRKFGIGMRFSLSRLHQYIKLDQDKSLYLKISQALSCSLEKLYQQYFLRWKNYRR